MRKILIIYATAGEGHRRAAIALKVAFDCLRPLDSEITIIDALDYANRFFRWFYPRIYIFMVSRLPTIWGFFYYCLDLKWLYPLVRFVRRRVNRNNTHALEEFLCRFNPELVISTHFLAAEVIASLKRQNRLQARLITCVTDFRMHSFWFADETELYCVGFEETRQDLIRKWRVAAQKIKVIGIPIHPKFYEFKDEEGLRNKLSISKNVFTVLITGGGFGVGPVTAVVKNLLRLQGGLQILAVCGHNEQLRQQINQLSSTSIKTFGFIDYVDELMSLSDVAVTKAGGLICSEAIARILPLIIVTPIPGQEARNSRLLLRNRAAFRIYRPCRVKNIIKKIRSDNSMLSEIKKNIKNIRKDNPALNIARLCLDI